MWIGCARESEHPKTITKAPTSDINLRVDPVSASETVYVLKELLFQPRRLEYRE